MEAICLDLPMSHTGRWASQCMRGMVPYLRQGGALCAGLPGLPDPKVTEQFAAQAVKAHGLCLNRPLLHASTFTSFHTCFDHVARDSVRAALQSLAQSDAFVDIIVEHLRRQQLQS